MTEKDKIVRACVKGKRKAFNKLYEMYAPKMLGVCLRYSKSYEEAEDVLQEGFIKVFQNIGSFAFQGSFDGWVRHVMVNTAINYYHAHKKYYENELYASNSENEGESFEPDGMYEEAQIPSEILMEMIQELPDGYKMVFNLRVFEGMSHADIASTLHISENTSKTQLYKARNRLKNEILKKYGNKIKNNAL